MENEKDAEVKMGLKEFMKSMNEPCFYLQIETDDNTELVRIKQENAMLRHMLANQQQEPERRRVIDITPRRKLLE